MDDLTTVFNCDEQEVTLSLSVSVCPCEVILLSLGFSKHLKLDVSRVLQECLMGVSKVSQCLNGVPRVY